MSFAFIFPLALRMAAEIEVSGKGGIGIASSPREEVEERADCRVKNREEATSEDGEDERVVVLGRGPVVG